MYSVVKRGQVYQPQVSGNGKVVVWRDLPKPGVSEIGIQRDGQEPTLLTDERVAVQNPRVNHDGSVVFFERHGGKDWDWDIARKEGNGSTQVVIDTEGMSTDFDITSDGNAVVADYWPKTLPRIRNVSRWTKDEGVRQLSPEGVSSGLPQIAGDGGRVFYLRLPKTAREPNEIWLQESDGSEKPVVYETGEPPELHQKNSFDTNGDGSVLVWTQKASGSDAKVFRWELETGKKEQVGEGILAGDAVVSQDGSTMAWIERDQNAQGETVSEVHWRRGDDERIVSSDKDGGNNTPSLSADGNTLVWMWKHEKVNWDHEIRKVVIDG